MNKKGFYPRNGFDLNKERLYINKERVLYKQEKACVATRNGLNTVSCKKKVTPIHLGTHQGCDFRDSGGGVHAQVECHGISHFICAPML